MSNTRQRNASVTEAVLTLEGNLKEPALDPELPRAATVVAAMIGGRKLRAARWIALCRDRQSVVALEYAIIAGVMVFVVFTVSNPFGAALEGMFNRIANAL